MTGRAAVRRDAELLAPKLIRRMDNFPDHHGHAFADADGDPNARLVRLTKYGPELVTVEQTDHYRVMREFCDDPAKLVEATIEE
jgi:hypothetical protein